MYFAVYFNDHGRNIRLGVAQTPESAVALMLAFVAARDYDIAQYHVEEEA